MSPRLRTLDLTSDGLLRELITDALPQLLGQSCELLADDLPFEGHLLLCVDTDKRPVVVAYDGRDGGRALLAGLAAIENLCDHRGLLFRLYPALFRGNPREGGAVFRSEDLRLVVLAPKALPGTAYLEQAFPALTTRTFRVIEADGGIGLLIDAAPHDAESASAGNDGPPPPFRSGHAQEPALTAEEAHYFDGI